MKTKQREFSIGDVSKITGASQKQLRFWEEKKYIAPPVRVVCGMRSYRYWNESQIQQIQSLKRLLDEGFTLPHASKMVREGVGKDD